MKVRLRHRSRNPDKVSLVPIVLIKSASAVACLHDILDAGLTLLVDRLSHILDFINTI
jgi:hypothetical protein